jgi:hypothetical protein
LVVSEIMHNPTGQADTVGEYVELYNAGGAPIDLLGAVIRDDGSDTFTVSSSLVVAPGAFVVLARSSSAAGGAVDYVYGTAMTLSNSDDEVLVMVNGAVQDRVSYDASFPLVAGRSLDLRSGALSATANDDSDAWCAATSALGNGDFGSPRAASSCSP